MILCVFEGIFGVKNFYTEFIHQIYTKLVEIIGIYRHLFVVFDKSKSPKMRFNKGFLLFDELMGGGMVS